MIIVGDSPQALRSRLAWDIVPDEKVGEWAEQLSLVPANHEGIAMEAAAANTRRARIRGVLPYALPMAQCAGDIASKAISIQNNIDVNHQVTIYAVQKSIVSVLANLVDMGIITVNPQYASGE